MKENIYKEKKKQKKFFHVFIQDMDKKEVV